MGAALTSGAVLRWSYVGYLWGLDAMLILRTPRTADKPGQEAVKPEPHAGVLLIVGLLAGPSSGFLGIGGRLATTVTLSAWLGVAQHQTQLTLKALG
jgi:uncharacterized protein